MGAALQYVTEKGVYNRNLNNNWPITDAIFSTVYDMFYDAEYNENDEDYGVLESMSFPLTKCPVKYQRPNDVDYYWQDVAGNGFRTIKCPIKYKQDIKNTMRWGAKLANRLYFNEMPKIIDCLNKFTKEFDAEDLADMYVWGIEFKFKVVKKSLIYSKIKFNGLEKNKWFNLMTVCPDDLYYG